MQVLRLTKFSLFTALPNTDLIFQLFLSHTLTFHFPVPFFLWKSWCKTTQMIMTRICMKIQILWKFPLAQRKGYQKNWTGPVAWELYDGDATQNFGPELWAKFQIPVLWQKGKERDVCRKPWPWDFGHNYKLTITDPFPTAYTEYRYCFLRKFNKGMK